MYLKDYLYGDYIVEEVIEELINTKEVQRLKNIHQGGASYLVNPNWNVSRYEHSIGVMLLIRLMGGDIEEQIAGLLHDVSHTAFSHVIDYVLDKHNEDYHEEIFESIIENSDIPKILNKYGYSYKDILYDKSKYTILEKTAPNLCADRIDYTLRDMFRYGFITKNEISNFMSSLVVVKNEIMVNSLEAAKFFVDTYYKEVIDYFMNPLGIYANDRLSKAIKIALNDNIIVLDDLLKDDKYVFNLLESSNNKQIKSLVESLNYNVVVVEDNKNYDIYQKNKLRLIDPSIYIENKIYKASEICLEIKELSKKALEKSERGSYIKIL
ncbi:HD domain-containing protein [Romboutsia ilealis]|uniref:HD domain-containing protein n=1 Tax=Romboutsia faecis TaxID=2764597 RepID=A0ABR7JKP6_9FIRM|nr:HD domain-containing protein [Romboutsia faecis]MBC5995494.1 HD domain-containing protein [Romboutsia faecis]MRN23695.1 HD domain-containing protein [Romboutsia ilealis]